MVGVQKHRYSTQAAQQSLAVQLLQPLLQQRHPQRVLVLKHDAAGELPLAPVSPVQIIRLSTDELSAKAVVHGRLSALPFADAVFELVVLQHLLIDGSEAVLQEALRVLAPGGDIVISGLNSAGLRYRAGNRADHFPGLKLNRIFAHLKSKSFKIQRCYRMGLAGMSRPLRKQNWFADNGYGLAMPFADFVVLHGHHQCTIENSSMLRFKRIQRSRVRPAALDGVSGCKIAS